MVAFLRKLPGLTPAEYRAIVAKAPPDDDMEPGHDDHPAAAPAASGSTAMGGEAPAQ
jgi:hypothetical protein